MTNNVSALSAAVRAAAERLRERVVHTPTLVSPWLSSVTGAPVRLKLENLQRTGSFKVRGASNAMQLLSAEQRRGGVFAASSGNHGLGVAAAAQACGTAATVYVPQTTPEAKRARIAELGAQVVVFGDDCVLTERQARQMAAQAGAPYLSPYNDAAVIAGQGTVAVELLADWPQVDVVYVALGGGGLISGMAAYARSVRPDIEFVACSPRNSPAMEQCVRVGRIAFVPCGPTLSDSTAGGVEPGAITLPLCRELVDRYLQVDEAQIAAAVVATLQHEHQLIEGAAGVAIAALLSDPELRGRRAAVIVCGGNLSLTTLRALLPV